ncbi:hypothetical protein [Streptomyces pinistramenti]|uniref:hypothetical protein n=1 Tax=Streptomyces pinistramenti TaxID=2884812 RepID=UPI001D0955DE|nr:hypothetical protein [Streptomyces pinistramenti]MCB5907378.1 hypothetical protein [Streptomyces pinistramenti]
MSRLIVTAFVTLDGVMQAPSDRGEDVDVVGRHEGLRRRNRRDEGRRPHASRRPRIRSGHRPVHLGRPGDGHLERAADAYGNNNPLVFADPNGRPFGRLFDQLMDSALDSIGAIKKAFKTRNANLGVSRPRTSIPTVSNRDLASDLKSIYAKPQAESVMGDVKAATAIIYDFNTGKRLDNKDEWHIQKGWGAPRSIRRSWGRTERHGRPERAWTTFSTIATGRSRSPRRRKSGTLSTPATSPERPPRR